MQLFRILLLLAFCSISESHQHQLKAVRSHNGQEPAIKIVEPTAQGGEEPTAEEKLEPKEGGEPKAEEGGEVKATEELKPKAENVAPPEIAAPGGGGVVMNIYHGPPPTEGVARPEETKEELGKIAGTVGRLESQEGASARHEMELQEGDARHAENQANVAAAAAVGQLEEETKQMQQEIKTEQAALTSEESTTDASLRAIKMGEEADASAEKAKEMGLSKKVHDIEKDMKKEEQLIKEDEEEIKEGKIREKEELAGVAEDEKANMERIKLIAAARNKKPEEVTVEDCMSLIKEKEEAEKPSPAPSKKEEKVETKMVNGLVVCEEPCGQKPEEKEKSTEAPTPPPLKASQLNVVSHKVEKKEKKKKTEALHPCQPLSLPKAKPEPTDQCNKKPCEKLATPEGYPPRFHQIRRAAKMRRDRRHQAR